jgi:hypothetical protein
MVYLQMQRSNSDVSQDMIVLICLLESIHESSKFNALEIDNEGAKEATEEETLYGNAWLFLCAWA